MQIPGPVKTPGIQPCPTESRVYIILGTPCLSSVVGSCCGYLEFSDELPSRHRWGGPMRQPCLFSAGLWASFHWHEKPEQVLFSKEEPSGKASWR